MVGSPHQQQQLPVFTVPARVPVLPFAGSWPTACSSSQHPKASQWAPQGTWEVWERTSALPALCFWSMILLKAAGRKKTQPSKTPTFFSSSAFWVCNILPEKCHLHPSVRRMYLDKAGELWEGLHLHRGLLDNLWMKSQLRATEERCRYKPASGKQGCRLPEAGKILW